MAGIGQGSSFAAQPSLGFCLDQFASEMLLPNSSATTLVDLQAELNALNLEQENAVQRKVSTTAGHLDIDLSWNLESYFDAN